jgi:hypothetical protein
MDGWMMGGWTDGWLCFVRMDPKFTFLKLDVIKGKDFSLSLSRKLFIFAFFFFFVSRVKYFLNQSLGHKTESCDYLSYKEKCELSL